MELRDGLRSRLQTVRNEVNNMLKEQENRVELLIVGLMKRYGKGIGTLVQSYKDIEDRSGK